MQTLRRRHAAALLILATVLAPAPGRGELIDRVLAVVNGRVITLSEVRAWIEFGLLEGVGPEAVEQAVTRLIERALVVAEVERFPLPEPDAAAIDERLRRVRERFATAEAYQAALARSGFTDAWLRETVRDSLRIDRYLAERFGAAAQPTDEDVARYYREHPAAFTVEGRLRPLEEVRDELSARLAADRRRALIADWVADLVRRADVVRLDRPSSG